MGDSRQQRSRLYEKLVGQEVAGRFEITALLGFGGMGAVYRAVQKNMQRDVALKVIPSHDPTTAARFKREALTISQLHHPNTVTVFDYGQAEDGLLYLAMEMLDGETLSERLARTGPLDPERAVHIATQVCRSLGEAHESDIVHRDIKPDNIFLIAVDDDPDFVKVLDFGIAKIVRGEENVDLTGTGRIIGTPKYMSPEQILGEGIDARSDLYSLACILFEMLCGRPPFEDSTTTKLMLAHAHKAPPTFAERLPPHALERIPGPLEQVVRRALSKAPGERHTDIDEFRRALETALGATEHPQTPVGERSSQAPSQPAPAPAKSGTTTDSSDLLSQHSSQTLAKLDRPSTGSKEAPDAAKPAPPSSQLEPDADSGADDSSAWKIAAVLIGLVAVAAAAYLVAFDGGSGPTGDDERHAAAAGETEQERDEPESNEEKPAAKEDEEPKTYEVRVTTEPKGANVFEEGRLVGKTPMNVERRAGETLDYRFERDEYREKSAEFEVTKDGELFMVPLDPADEESEDEQPAAKREPRQPEPAPPQPSEKPEPDKSASDKDKRDEESASNEKTDERPEESEGEKGDDEEVRPSVDKLDEPDGPNVQPLD